MMHRTTAGKRVLISIDYDQTYTADPLLWDQFIAIARGRGHDVVCVTSRHEPPGPHERRIPCQVICARGEYKRHAAAKAGHAVDIWIDDMPEVIAPSGLLDWSSP